MKNKMITKAVAIWAAGILAFGLTACGETTNTTEESQGTTDVTTDNSTDNDTDTTDDTQNVSITIEDTDVTYFTIEVTDADGNTTSYEGYSSDEFLFDALDEVEGFTYDGYDAEWGYYITTINDLAADYDADGAYWALYVNGEYGMNGVQTEPLVNNNVYTFVYEVYQAN